MSIKISNIKAIIGLGNPGQMYKYTRHNIGFRIVDELIANQNGLWISKDLFDSANIALFDQKIIVIKPNTYMNDSGKVIPFLIKKGIKPQEILVIHDELEKKFGVVVKKYGGSHKGHNGLKSIMAMIGPDFWRVCCGIGRPNNKEEVSNYVLSNFLENDQCVDKLIVDAISCIE